MTSISACRPQRLCPGEAWEGVAEFVDRLSCPIGVEQVHRGHYVDVGAAAGDDAIGIGKGLVVPDGHGRHVHFQPDPLRKQRLEKAAVNGLLIGHDLSR